MGNAGKNYMLSVGTLNFSSECMYSLWTAFLWLDHSYFSIEHQNFHELTREFLGKNSSESVLAYFTDATPTLNSSFPYIFFISNASYSSNYTWILYCTLLSRTYFRVDTDSYCFVNKHLTSNFNYYSIVSRIVIIEFWLSNHDNSGRHIAPFKCSRKQPACRLWSNVIEWCSCLEQFLSKYQITKSHTLKLFIPCISHTVILRIQFFHHKFFRPIQLTWFAHEKSIVSAFGSSKHLAIECEHLQTRSHVYCSNQNFTKE